MGSVLGMEARSRYQIYQVTGGMYADGKGSKSVKDVERKKRIRNRGIELTQTGTGRRCRSEKITFSPSRTWILFAQRPGFGGKIEPVRTSQIMDTHAAFPHPLPRRNATHQPPNLPQQVPRPRWPTPGSIGASGKLENVFYDDMNGENRVAELRSWGVGLLIVVFFFDFVFLW